MKKFKVLLTTLSLALLLCACGKDKAETEEYVGMANPNEYNVGRDLMVQTTGIDIAAPQNASDVSYNVIGYKDDNPMSEVTFTLDDQEYCYRAQVASPEIPVSGDSALLIEDSVLEYANISGIYDTWKTKAVMSVDSIDGVLITSSEYTVYIWCDSVAGILYNLSVYDRLSIDGQRDFCSLASSIYAPVQGDVDSDTADEADAITIDVVGSWTQLDPPEDSYSVLELKDDGSGSLMTEPEDIGVPLNYEVDGTTITTHLGSVDDNTLMEYLPDTDQIKYDNIYFSRD